MGFFLFLYLFEAFRISDEISWTGHSLLERSLSYALLVGWSYFALDFSNFDRVWRRVAQVLSANLMLFFALNYFWGGRDWAWSTFIEIGWQGTAIQLVIGLIWYLLQRVLQSSREPDKLEQLLTLYAENGKLALSVKADHLIFAKSDGNYLELYLAAPNEKVEKKLLRKSLKALSEDLKDRSQFMRVHKQHLVNLNRVERFENRTGKLTLNCGEDLIIPIGTAYQENLQEYYPNFAPK